MYNPNYNPKGGLDATTFRFPYPDDTFDFAFLTSVFTHMLPEAVDNYLCELNRVLKPGGRFLCTYFLLNDVSEDLIRKGKTLLPFALRDGVCRYNDALVREAAVAYDESYVRARYARYGFEPGVVRWGSWSGRPDATPGQDCVVASKVRWAGVPWPLSARRQVGRFDVRFLARRLRRGTPAAIESEVRRMHIHT